MRDALGPRVLSGVVLAAVALLATHIGGVAFQVVVASAALLLVWEWDRLVGGSGFGLVPAVLAVFGMAALVAMNAGAIVVTAFMVIAGAVLAALIAWWTRRSWAWAVAGSTLVAVAAVAAVWLRAEPESGRIVVLWLFAVIWSTDSGAYSAGRIVGGPPLAPRVSPRKTWAGLIGGTAAGSMIGAGFAAVSGVGPFWALIVLSSCVSLVGQGGDLLISRIKRHFHVKDTGRLIPGHGGILDRLDSTVASLPVVALGMAGVQATGARWP